MPRFFERAMQNRLQLLLLLCIFHLSSWTHASLVQTNPQGEKLLRVEIAQQVNATRPDSIVYRLTPTLTVVTMPLGAAKNNAVVTIYNGELLLYTVTLTQTSPVFVCTFDLILGSVKIENGMRLTLQIPSSLQSGSIFMQATFSDLNVPATIISAMVATWSL